MAGGRRISGCEAQNDVKACGKLPYARIGNRRERHDYRVPRSGIPDAVQDSIGRVERISFDIKLRHQSLDARNCDLEMDVPCASRIQPRLYRPEKVLARRSRDEAPIALKIAVPIGNRALRVDISAVVVRLPDLDQSIANRLTALIENTATQPCDLADCRSNVVADDDQVVVPVERQPVRIIRPERLGRSKNKLLGKAPGTANRTPPRLARRRNLRRL